MRRSILIVAVLAALCVIALMLYAGEPNKPVWWIGGLMFMAWAVGPFALAVLAERVTRRLAPVWLTAATAIAAVGGGFVYSTSFFGERVDAQAGLVFVFVPPMQYLLIGLGWGIAALLGRNHAAR